MKNTDRRIFIINEIMKGNLKGAASVNREAKYFEIRDSKKESYKDSNSKT